MVIALLVLIALILLFGAAVVRGWLRNVLGALVGCMLLAAAIMVAISLMGEGSFVWIWIGGGLALFVAALWARHFDPAEAEHKARVKRAQMQREERRRNGLKW